MSKSFLGVLLIVVPFAVGCSSTITMRHPDGRTATCGGYSTAFQLGDQVAAREARCISDYQRQGFERMPQEKRINL
jgi:hypothetical protein